MGQDEIAVSVKSLLDAFTGPVPPPAHASIHDLHLEASSPHDMPFVKLRMNARFPLDRDVVIIARLSVSSSLSACIRGGSHSTD